MPITKYIKGNLLEAKADYIAHGVNCQGVMGSGVAKAIRDAFPEVYETYKHICDFNYSKTLLGVCNFVLLDKSKSLTIKGIYNLFTQDFYGRDEKRYVNYKAIVDSFSQINSRCKNETIAIPKIGAGLGGGDWNIIKELIDDSTPNVEIHVYEL